MSTGPATNAQVTAGKDLTVVSGRDASFTGANVGGDNVYMDVGRNLVVASRQNESSNSSKGFNFDVTFTPNGGVSSFNLGGSYGFGARKYTDTPTTIIANKVLDIYTGQTTFLLGAVLNSKTGALKLDTGNFVFDNFNDTEQQKNIAVSIGVDVKDPSKTSLGGSLYYKNKAGITYATVGAGEIKIRNNPTQNLITLNRDAANVQRVVKDQTIDH